MAEPRTRSRKTLDTEEEHPRSQVRPSNRRFLLQVDRQTKSSYESLEEARTAGQRIKDAHPVVEVTIYDSTGEEGRVVLAPERQ